MLDGVVGSPEQILVRATKKGDMADRMKFVKIGGLEELPRSKHGRSGLRDSIQLNFNRTFNRIFNRSQDTL